MTPSSCSISAMRTGPSRLTSTAVSSGESNDTVAAEWMTMSQDASSARPVVVEAEPVGADIAGDGGDPAGDLGVEVAAAAVVSRRSRSNASFLSTSRRTRSVAAAAAGPDEQDELAVGHPPQQPLDERGAEEPGGTGDGDALAGQLAPRSRAVVYHLVDEVSTDRYASALW